MPELPEAETIVRGLRDHVPGRRVHRVRIQHEDVLRSDPERFRAAVVGRRIQSVERRGKNIVLVLDRERRVMVNLGMTGKLLPGGSVEGAGSTHPAVVFDLEDDRVLVFDDVRRFGAVECLSRQEWRSRDRALGVEPLSQGFTGARLYQLLAGSRSPIRSWLLDQRKVVGVGNIYAAEALWRARIHPRRPARSLTKDESGRLHRAVRRVLRRAVEAGGTTIRDYRNADGGRGAYGDRLAVYGREGEPCPRCSARVERVVFGGRSAFLCPRCQAERTLA